MRIGICIPFYNNSEQAKERCIYLLETLKEQNFEIFCDVVVVIDGRERMETDKAPATIFHLMPVARINTR